MPGEGYRDAPAFQFDKFPENSLELRVIVNAARKAHGEPEVRNNKFITKIEDELGDELPTARKVQSSSGGEPATCYDLTKDQCILVGMRESKAVRRSVLNQLKSLEAKLNATQPAQPQLPDFSNPAAAARAWADEVEQKEAIKQEKEQLQIAIQAMDEELNHLTVSEYIPWHQVQVAACVPGFRYAATQDRM